MTQSRSSAFQEDSGIGIRNLLIEFLEESCVDRKLWSGDQPIQRHRDT